MRAQSLVESLYACHAAGLPFPPISGGDGTTDPPVPAPAPAPDLNKLVADAIAKHGDQTSTLKAFAADLYAARDDLKAARAKIPGDGAIVLSGDDAKDWGGYRGLGKPSDLRKIAEEHKGLSEQVGTFQRDESLRTVAEKTGTRFAVLRTLAGPSLVFGEAKAKGKDGKETTIVTVKDGEAEAVPFDTYAASKWVDFLPSLKPGTKAETTTTRPNPTPVRTETHRFERTFTPPVSTAAIDPKARAVAAVKGAF